MCATLSWFVHVTVLPTLTVNGVGENEKLAIVTASPAAVDAAGTEAAGADDSAALAAGALLAGAVTAGTVAVGLAAPLHAAATSAVAAMRMMSLDIRTSGSSTWHSIGMAPLRLAVEAGLPGLRSVPTRRPANRFRAKERDRLGPRRATTPRNGPVS